MRTAGLAAVLFVLQASITDAAEGQLSLTRIEGDYKIGFESEMVGGSKVAATDELQIVRHGNKEAFISVTLSFANGHECYLSGIAALRGSALVYRKPDEPAYDCRLTLAIEQREITFDDQGDRCQRLTCGARGHYAGIAFPRSSRRPHRDVTAIRSSEEFKNAVTDFKKLPAEP